MGKSTDRAEDIITANILADRQALQSEMKQKIDEYSSGLPSVKERMLHIVQAVFAQQSQPEESQPEPQNDAAFQRDVTRETHRHYQREIENLKAESDRRVLAEREACAKTAISWTSNYREVDISHKVAAAIRARSNQPEEKPNLTPFDPECSTCVREADEAADRAAKRVDRMISSTDRIATLHEWQAKDAQTIEQLNASNNALSEKVAQLKKEKYELTQIVEYAKDDAHKNHYRGCSCLLCQPSPAS